MSKQPTKNIKMRIAYEGTRYLGWQRLGKGSEEKSIQGILESVLSEVAESEVRLIGSGRTDAGVHALGQVANCQIPKAYPLEKLLKETNRRLPEDIQIVQLEEVDPAVHSRFDAKEKVYEYRIDVRAVPNVFTRTLCLPVQVPLDVANMKAAARFLEGTHDFSGYASAMPDGRGTIKTVKRIDFLEREGELCLRFTGDGFLYNMVRIMVGTLLEVGKGTRSVESVKIPLLTRNRQDAGPTISGIGLFLSNVVY